jgi:hypothetical protein
MIKIILITPRTLIFYFKPILHQIFKRNNPIIKFWVDVGRNHFFDTEFVDKYRVTPVQIVKIIYIFVLINNC